MRNSLIIVLLSATLAHAGANYNAAVLADSPSAWWKQAELLGSTVVDSSGNGRNGGYNGGFTLGHPGIFGAGCGDTSVLYDGVSGNATMGNDAAYHVATTGQFTVETWAKMVTIPPAVNLGLVSKGGVAPPNAFEWVMIPHNSGADWTWDVLQSTGADHSFASSTTAVSTTQWQHIVGTIIDSTNTKIYINGVPEATSTSFSGTAGTSSLELFIGQSTDCSVNPCVQRNVNTYSAMTAVYPTALSAARVLAHYTAYLADVAACASTPTIRRRVYQMQ